MRAPDRDGASRARTTTLAVDTGDPGHAAAERHLRLLENALGAARSPSYVASTHRLPGESSHAALVLSWQGDPRGVAERVRALLPHAEVHVAPGACWLLSEHLWRRSGRLARFPGQDRLRGSMRADEVIRHGVVDQIRGLPGVTVTADSQVLLGDHVRPVWDRGRCVLLVEQAATGLVPVDESRRRPDGMNALAPGRLRRRPGS